MFPVCFAKGSRNECLLPGCLGCAELRYFDDMERGHKRPSIWNGTECYLTASTLPTCNCKAVSLCGMLTIAVEVSCPAMVCSEIYLFHVSF
ncbi:hypothetical protein ONE63_008035 [Megalurothrips usitatus]|uniref:Uncharacterized protein n=1 Tax=Megalurothrips usitatus TaxID=439358 RepID=A0AAV7XUG1_9NEOP|nr:hypothetical protein ONE63_008035 [Megalurothrips usitatus]